MLELAIYNIYMLDRTGLNLNLVSDMYEASDVVRGSLSVTEQKIESK